MDGMGDEPCNASMEWVDEVPVEDDFLRAMKDIQQLPYVTMFDLATTQAL